MQNLTSLEDNHAADLQIQASEAITVAAADSLAEQETSAVETGTLAALFEQEARRQQREDLLGSILMLTGMFILIRSAYAFVGDAATLSASLRVVFGALLMLGTGMCAIPGVRSYRRRGALLRALDESRDVRQVGDLVRILKLTSTPVRNLAKQQLIHVLPRLQASDAPRLGGEERSILLRHLAISPRDTGYRDITEIFSHSAYRREVEFRLAILKAMEQVGGERELPVVERLSRGVPSVTSASWVPAEVRAAAKECLPFLQARIHEQRESAQLLRASSRQSAAPGELLRPTSSENVDTSQLLVPTGLPGQE
jgi:hypothetical protein